MKWTLYLPLIILGCFLMAAGKPSQLNYKVRNSELGILYNPINWDRLQWEEVFRDPAPPMGWAIMPVGRESCSALTSWWMKSVRDKGLRPQILTAPFLNKREIEQTIDCAAALGVRRVVLDEYVSYQSKNLKRDLCTVIAEARDIYQNAKRKYPALQLDIDDNWTTWMVDLSRGQAGSSCGHYPYFQYDQTGISVLSKYGNPATGQCGHPTLQEMEEQLIDAKQTVRDYSKTGKVFVWQLNQHWYPGGDEVLQLFREARSLYGWRRSFLFGATADESFYGQWGYKASASREGCFSGDYNWHLSARDYLIKITEGEKSRITLSAPSSASKGSNITIDGQITSKQRGIFVNNVYLRITRPPNSVQRFEQQIISPAHARLAFVGVRINTQQLHKMTGPANFQLERVHFARTGSSNQVVNPEFDDDLDDWLILSESPVTVGTNASGKFLQASPTAKQTVSITSTPMFVTPKRTYTLRFDARILDEAANNAYFFVSWYTTKEVQRDRIFMTFPKGTNIAKTSSSANGNFSFQWQPDETGVYTVGAFFPGTPSYQPRLRTKRIEVR